MTCCREWMWEQPMPGGVQCELDEGHDGDHRGTTIDGTLTVLWDEDDEWLRQPEPEQ